MWPRPTRANMRNGGKVTLWLIVRLVLTVTVAVRRGILSPRGQPQGIGVQHPCFQGLWVWGTIIRRSCPKSEFFGIPSDRFYMAKSWEEFQAKFRWYIAENTINTITNNCLSKCGWNIVPQAKKTIRLKRSNLACISKLHVPYSTYEVLKLLKFHKCGRDPNQTEKQEKAPPQLDCSVCRIRLINWN